MSPVVQVTKRDRELVEMEQRMERAEASLETFRRLYHKSEEAVGRLVGDMAGDMEKLKTAVGRLQEDIRNYEDETLGLKGALENRMAEVARLRESIPRAIELLHATQEFISVNPIGEYTVTYDEAECDGACLADDCLICEEKLRLALETK